MAVAVEKAGITRGFPLVPARPRLPVDLAAGSGGRRCCPGPFRFGERLVGEGSRDNPVPPPPGAAASLLRTRR